MPTAYVFFCRGINLDTASSLVHTCRALLGELDANTKKPLWDTLSVAIASGGGDVIGAFAMFNELKGLQANVNTHNAGAVDSSAIMPFLAGARRTASAASAFFFHQLHWTFPAQGALTMSTISDATVWLNCYEGLMADAVAARTTLTRQAVLDMMRDGTSMDPAAAKNCGLIHDIEELATPAGARTWQA